jgi:hypothetical protein
MKIAVMGTGPVGQALAGKLDELGDEVTVGTRDPEETLARNEPDYQGNPPFKAWLEGHPRVRLEAPANAAGRGGAGRERDERRRLTRHARGSGQGAPGAEGARRRCQSPRLLSGDASLTARLEHRLRRGADSACLSRREGRQGPQHDELRSDGRPVQGAGEHDVFVCGEDAGAKQEVAELLQSSAGKRRASATSGHFLCPRNRDVRRLLAPALGSARNRLLQHRGRASAGKLVAVILYRAGSRHRAPSHCRGYARG